MEQTKPMPSKLQPLFESIVDCSTIGLGLGIFAKYAPIWINDPTSRSGIILAGVLNATALGIANYLTIDEKTPYLHKIVITVITLTATALATPYFALALKDRFMIILTPNVAFQMAGLNLAVKTIYYTVAYFGSQKTGQIEEIEHFSDVKIQEKYESFKTPDGKIKWMEQTEEVRLKYLKAFYDNDCSFFAFDNDTFKKMYVPVSEVIIKNITKPQASWIHNILTSREPLELQDDVAKNYVTLFYNNEFPPLPNLDNFTLPIEECDVAHLNPTQVAWHKKFTKNDATWNLFSLELKDKLNKKFVESGLEANPLRLSPGD